MTTVMSSLVLSNVQEMLNIPFTHANVVLCEGGGGVLRTKLLCTARKLTWC